MNCIICGNSTKFINDVQLNKKFFYCHHCEFIFLDKNQIVDAKKEKYQYDQHNNSLDDKGYVDMLNLFIDNAINPFVNEDSKGLEFGSGPTPVLTELLKMRSYDMIKYDKYYYDYDEYLNYHYDFISSTEVIEHIDNPLEIIKKLLTLLKDGGVLSLMTLFHENDEDKFKKWWYRRDPTHISFFNLNTFKYIANQLNLEIIYTDNKRVITLKK